ncbi:hypothetical protein NZNM25_14180 [Nitrosopumilus zosterae]|uniref:Uncharacterized protein n=1 Tax=Nitrosopumilus zosterae TaxID=718286 RepID=A0A2S2KSV1_9ARCH|nr:hypothetical protein [Nitrosopumilus zosterae]BDQ30758.1 hypothetical protein NZOSNM25_000864 [Nitrosopumilus zosterae]GBH34627.1 hypothetical protein NZNM25_14180 [Nitrosopumilus zosterae]
MNKLNILFFAAAVTTAIAGIIHVVLGIPSNNLNSQVLFVVGGATQIFWAVPMIRKWGTVWYGIGLGGTLMFIAIWVITRIPDNFITGRGGRISDNGILVEAFQIAFVGIVIAILVLDRKSFSKKEGNAN